MKMKTALIVLAFGLGGCAHEAGLPDFYAAETEAMFGEATAALEDINSVFEDVVDIVEPLMPVLDEISALT